MPLGALERIAAVLAGAVDDDAVVGEGPIIAVGWATVELDRAAFELATDLGTTPSAFAPASDSVVLGARCRIMRAALPGRVALAIVEPATEGRLAGWLARHGEGPAAVWLAAGTTPTDSDAAGGGPFGAERLASQRISNATQAWLLIVRGAGTIDG